MIILPQSDMLTFPTDSEPPTTPSDTKSSSQSDKSQVSSTDSTHSRQDKADFHSDRSQPAIRESKESRYTADSVSTHEGNRGTTVSPASRDQPGRVDKSSTMKQGDSLNEQQGGGTPPSQAQPQNAHEPRVREMSPPTKQEGSSNKRENVRPQSQVPNPHLEAHAPQDGAPSTDQRQASSELRGATSQSQVPPPEVHKPQEESVREKLENRQPPDTVTASQSTVPQSQARRESMETKPGHPSGDDGLNKHQAQAQTREVREPESNRESSFGGEKDRSTGSHSASSNKKKDPPSHRL